MKQAITSVVFVISLVSLLALGLVSRVQAERMLKRQLQRQLWGLLRGFCRGQPSRRDRGAHRRREGKYFRS